MSLLYYLYYSRTEEISLDKNVTTEVTQDEKNEKEPSDDEVWEPLLSPTPTKSKKSLATEKGSGGPLGGAQNNPLHDYHIVMGELKGLQHVAQTAAGDDYHIVKIELKVLLHDAQKVAENDFQDGQKQLFCFNS